MNRNEKWRERERVQLYSMSSHPVIVRVSTDDWCDGYQCNHNCGICVYSLPPPCLQSGPGEVCSDEQI